jgi:CheY-like chemotaxis protein
MEDNILSGRTILVAEDDKDLREIIADVLRMHGAHILEAENGEVALGLYLANAVDLVVSDIRMPNGDGITFLAGVRRQTTPKKPFVFLSGYSDLSLAEATRLGAQGMFAKPFDVAELVTAISNLMPAA